MAAPSRPAIARAPRRRPATRTSPPSRLSGARRRDAEARRAARRGRRRIGARRGRDPVQGHGRHGAVPGARPGVVPGPAAERGAGVLVGAVDPGGRAGGRQDEGVAAARSRARSSSSRAATPPSLSKTYRAADVRDAVHEFANDIVQSFTGQRGVFGSRIAFALTGHGAHEIAVVDMDGGRMAVITKMGSDSLLPAFSPGGAEIAFTSYLRNNPDLWIVSAGRRARAPRVEAARAQHGRGLVARRAGARADPVLRRKLRALPDQPRRRAGAGAPDQQPGHRQLAVVLAGRIADRVRLEPAGLAADLHHAGQRAAPPSASPSRASTTRRRASARAPTSRRSPSPGATSAACSTSSSSTSRAAASIA